LKVCETQYDSMRYLRRKSGKYYTTAGADIKIFDVNVGRETRKLYISLVLFFFYYVGINENTVPSYKSSKAVLANR